jgi:hypothetical protein
VLVPKTGGDQPLELTNELMGTLRRKVDFENLDGDERIASALVRAEYRPERPCSDLMQNMKRTKYVVRSGTGNFRVQ